MKRSNTKQNNTTHKMKHENETETKTKQKVDQFLKIIYQII